MLFDFNPDAQEPIPEMLPPKERRSRFSIAMTLAFLLLIGVSIVWNPVTDAMKTAWGRHCAREAHAALDAQDWSRAVEQTIAARNWAPEDVEVRRAVIEFLMMSGSDPGGLVMQLRALADKQPLTEEEQLLLGRTLAATGKTAEARVVYDRLPPKASSQKPALELLSSILRQEGHNDEALALTRRATLKQPETPEAKLKLALEDMKGGFVEIRRHAHDELLKLARLETEIAMKAVTHLTIDPQLTTAEARQLLDIVENHAHKQLPVRLGVVSALMRLQPDQRDTLLDGEIKRFRSGDDGALAHLARWLALEKQHARLLKVVPMRLAVKSRELYPIIAQALAEEGRWQDLKEVLTESRPPVSQSRVAIWLAEASSHLTPDIQEAKLLLESSIEASILEGNPANILAAAVVAERLKLPEVALNAYQAAASKVGEKALPLLQKAHELALLQRNTAVLLQIAHKLHELRPSSAIFQARLIYLRLLLGVEMETIDLSKLENSSSLHAAFTITLERIPTPLLQALSDYRLGDRTAMQQHLAQLNSGTSLAAGPRAVAAGLLSLVGKPDRAFQLAEKIPGALLLDEELTFLKRAL